jgi:heme-degrading monooxygenase HmoA
MHMRMLQVTIRPEELPGLARLYEDRIIPALENVGGCLFACLLQSVHQLNEGMSMTLWRTEEDALRYEQSGLFKRLLGEAQPYFADATEWKLELTKDFTLEYTPTQTEPQVKTFSVSTSSGSTVSSTAKAQRPFLRIVSVHLKPGKLEEYKELYQRDIVPALLATNGCQFSCLSTPTDGDNEAISVTLWNSRQDAEEYERKGSFNQLLHNVSHTLSDLSQLRIQSAGTRLPSVTSEDVGIDGFHLIASKSFLP